MALGILFAAAILQSSQTPQTAPPTQLPAPVQPTLTVPVVPAKPDGSKVLVTIDGSPITASDIENYLWEWKSPEVLNAIENFRLVSAEATRRGITVSDADVLKSMDDQIKRFASSLPPGKNVDEALADQGYPKTRLFLTLKSSLQIDKIVLADFNPQNYLKVSTIIVKPKSSNLTDLAPAIKTAQAYYDRLKKGEAWTKVLAESTQDPNVLGSNGVLGWTSLNVFPPAVKDEIKTLKVGQYTQPAQTRNGIQVFRVDALGSSATASEINELKAQYLTQGRQQLLNRLHAQAKIEKGP